MIFKSFCQYIFCCKQPGYSLFSFDASQVAKTKRKRKNSKYIEQVHPDPILQTRGIVFFIVNESQYKGFGPYTFFVFFLIPLWYSVLPFQSLVFESSTGNTWDTVHPTYEYRLSPLQYLMCQIVYLSSSSSSFFFFYHRHRSCTYVTLLMMKQ